MHASVTSLLDLPLVSISTFLEGVVVHLTLFRSKILLAVIAPCLHFKPLDLLSRDLMFVFVYAQEDFSSLDPHTPYATSSLSRLFSASM
jgi:hypothetical protein